VEVQNPYHGEDLLLVREPEVPLDRRKGKDLLAAVWRLHDRGRYARKPYEPLWDEYRRFWRGDQRTARESPKYIFNHVFKIVEQIVATMTEEMFTINVLPTEPQDEELTETLTKAAQWSVERMNALMLMRQFIRDGYVDGTAIGKTFWNPDLERGLGNSGFRPVDNLRFIPDPDATSIHPAANDALFVVQELLVDTDYVYRRYGKRVDADEDLTDKKYPGDEVMTASRVTPTGTVSMPPVQGSPRQILTRRCRMIEAWVRDFLLVDYGVSLPDKLRQKAEEPNWVIVTATRDQLLDVRPNPYPYFPFVSYVPTGISNQFYGFSEVQNMIDPQREYNTRRTQVAKHAAYHASPAGMISPRSRLDHNNLRIEPGRVYPLFGDFQWLQAAPLDSAVITSAQLSLNDLEDITGVPPIARGYKEPNVSAGVAIEALQGQALTRINAKTKAFEEPLRQIAENIVGNILRYWTEPRIIRLIGDTDTPIFQKIDLADVLRRARDVLQFDVRVRVGNTVAQKIAKQNTAIALANFQILDAEAILEAFEWPGRRQILERLEKRRQEEMQLAASQQQQAAGPPENPLDPGVVSQAQSVEDLPPEIRALFDELRSSGMSEEDMNTTLLMLQEELPAGMEQSG